MADSMPWKFVVWERLNKTGKWCPYSAEVSQLIEQSYKKNLDIVSLGDAEEDLKIYSVNLKDMIQVSKVTGMFILRFVYFFVNFFVRVSLRNAQKYIYILKP